METWNYLVDKFDLLLTKLQFGRVVKIAGREVPPLVMGFALIVVCIPVWGYLEVEGDNKFIGALVVILMAWAVAQLGALGFGDGVGEKPGSSAARRAGAAEQPLSAAGTQPDQRQRLALFVLAGVVVAVAVVYVLRNVDRYEGVSSELRYSELVDMVKPIQNAMESALLARSVSDIGVFHSGEVGLPDEVLVSEEAHGISVIEGQIIATWKTDESDLDGVTYILTPKMEDGAVEWATTGTCGGKKAC
ncbi:MAG: hypothetical protein AAGG11_15945 [Pseudomonadota bacterium]